MTPASRCIIMVCVIWIGLTNQIQPTMLRRASLHGIRLTFCHVCCNHQCACSEERCNDLLVDSELNVDICSPSTNNMDGVPLLSHMNQFLCIDNTCDLNGTDYNVYKPITHVTSANTPPIESALYDPKDSTLDTNIYLDNSRTKYPRNLFISHLNENSIRHIFF